MDSPKLFFTPINIVLPPSPKILVPPLVKWYNTFNYMD
jgi:hypothetical protein